MLRRSPHEDKSPHLQGQGCQRCSDLPKLGRWDLTMYRHAGCRDHTLLPYAIRSLQGYPGELVWSSGMDITLDDVLMILDELLQQCESARCAESGTIRIADGW